MGRIKEKKKHFKHPRSYYAEFAFIIFAILTGIFSFYFILQMSENEAYEFFINRKQRIMDSDEVYLRILLIFLVKKLGKIGALLFFATLILLFIYALTQEIKEFRRYKYKCRLYHEGIIKNIYDIYDDYEKQSLLTKIRNLFLRKNRKKYKYPTKKELKNIENKIKNMTK